MCAYCTQLLEQAVISSVATTTFTYVGTSSALSSSDEGADFFDFTQTGADAASSEKYLEYLNDNNSELSMLDRHLEVRQMFICCNTCLSSSAPVERLFSSGALVLTKR